MAQGDGAIYNKAKVRILSGEMNLASGGNSLKVALVYGYTPNIDTHENWADVSASQVSGTNYAAGGVAVTGQAVTQDNTNDNAKFDINDPAWTSLTITTPANATPSHAILYNDTHANDALICYWEVTTVTNGGNYTLQINTAGVFTFS